MNKNLVYLLAAAAILFVWGCGIYASLIKKRNKVLEKFSGIDVQLKKKYGLISGIWENVSDLADNERDLKEEITRLTEQVLELPSNFENIDRKIALDGIISEKIGQITADFENRPQSAAKPAIQAYNEAEEHISDLKHSYNSAAGELKNAVEIFPSSLFARLMNIKTADFFKTV